MKRAILLAALVCLAGVAVGCSGGGSTTLDETTGPLVIKLVAASPSSGPSPLRTTFTANISGGKAPYFYAWDFTNDGAFDRYINAEFNRTISVTNDYFLRASDAGGSSSYEAVLRVTDAEGTKVTSDPVEVVVNSTGGLVLPPELATWFTDEQQPDGSYVASTGKPVFFRASVSGGDPPYKYQWDFNNDGEIDSTLAAPQYTFTNNDPGAKVFVVHLTVIDSNNEKIFYDYLVPVFGTAGTPPPSQGFDLILNSDPEASDGSPYPVIELLYDPSGATEGVPMEPHLDLSAVVNPSGSSGGTPPFEYYWDFDNDGAYDSQEPSPTIPYYDSSRKLFLNPYLHQEDFKAFTLRLTVLDSNGQLEERYRTVISRNISQGGIQLTIDDVQYGTFGIAGPPFAAVQSSDDTTPVDFQIQISGSTGSYEYTFDGNGDGDPDLPLVDTDGDPNTDPEPGWGPIIGNTLQLTVDFQGLGYFPAKFNIRAVQGASVADTTSVDTPISLVKRKTVTVDGSLGAKANLGAAATWDIEAGGGNGQFIASREMVLAGGSRGTTLLRDVQRITETFSQPADQGSYETSQDVLATTHYPMNQERSGLMMWNNGANIIAHGGTNPLNGILGTNEWTTTLDPSLNAPWEIKKETRVSGIDPPFYPLTEAEGAVNPDDGLFYFCGGVHPPTESDADNVSAKLISYDPALDDPLISQSPYTSIGLPIMITERYDAAAAVSGGKMYVVGGRVASGQSVATVEAYNFNTHAWEALPPMQDARSGATALAIGGKIYVHGGAYYPSNEASQTLLQTAEVYNPNTGVWSYTLPLDTPSNNGAAVAMPGPGAVSDASQSNNTIWYFGGDGANGELNLLEEFVYFYNVFPEPPAP